MVVSIIIYCTRYGRNYYGKVLVQKEFKTICPPAYNTLWKHKNTAGMSIGVFEELILWIIATMIGNITGFYGLWYGLLVANIVHLILFHIILLPLSYRHYVPGEITAWLTIIPCWYILKLAQNILGYSVIEITIWVTIGIVFAFVNMKVLHKNINKLSKLVE